MVSHYNQQVLDYYFGFSSKATIYINLSWRKLLYVNNIFCRSFRAMLRTSGTEVYLNDCSAMIKFSGFQAFVVSFEAYPGPDFLFN